MISITDLNQINQPWLCC